MQRKNRSRVLSWPSAPAALTRRWKSLKSFAKLFPAGSKVVRCEYDSKDVAVVARKTRSGYEAVVANVSYAKQTVVIKLGKKQHRVVLDRLELKKVIFD